MKNIKNITTLLLIGLFLSLLNSLHTDAQISGEPISSFEYAYDRLLADVFDNDAGVTEIFGSRQQVAGNVYMETANGTVLLGQGPGWVFYYADTSLQTTIYYGVLVSISGKVERKAFKNTPLKVDHFEKMYKTKKDQISAKADLKSAEQAYNWLIHNLLGHTVMDKRIYVYPDKFDNGATFKSFKETVHIGEGTGWSFFIDDNPMANWEHACRFVFVNEQGDIAVKRSTMPPNDLHLYRELTEPIPEPAYRINSSKPSIKKYIERVAQEATPANNRWAVIISGGATQGTNHVRYWNDSSYFYETLINHGFLDDHIFVLISDGTDPAIDRSDGTNSPLDLDGDGDDDTQFSATPANITTVFNQLATDLDGDDILYVFTTDHGDSSDACPWDDPDASLNLWLSSISDANFAVEINRVTTLATVVIFEQCFSGGMLDDLQANNRVLISAARFWELSYSGRSQSAAEGYDEFSYYMTHALDNPVDADKNEDNIVSMEEAYLYALANDSYQSEDLSACADNSGEHPSYFSNPWDLGRRISLYGIEKDILYNPLMARYSQTSGYIQTEIQETYPTGGTAQNWKADDGIWQYNLPFNFPYGSQSYSTIWVDSNGIIRLNTSGSLWENTINGLVTNRMIAPLWDDLNTANTGDDIFISSSSNDVTIRWQAHTLRDAIARPVNVAVKLSSNGAIRFLYGSGNDHTSRIVQRDKSIGISLGSNEYHLSLRNGQWNLGDAKGIEYVPYSVIYLDASYSGTELGTKLNPYNMVSEGYNAIPGFGYGSLLFKAGTYTGPGSVPITLNDNKTLTLKNYDGPAVIK